MKKKLIQHTTEHFEKTFQKTPEHIFLSPGRINIIGEHIDYNDGFVMPAAINKYICFAVSKNSDSHCTLIAKDLNEAYKFDLNEDLKPIDKMWANYILGVLHEIKQRGYTLKGFDMVFSSTIPMGAGLSSSAALECGIGYAMNKLYDLGLTKEDIALIGQKSEHTFVGVNCGIMDQFASVFGKKNSVIKLDCNTLEYEYYKADFKKYSLLLLDSNVKHTHLTSGYNVRRQEVEEGLAIIKEHFPQIKTFRDCSEEMILGLKEQLGETIFKRCHFVVKEIQRVLDAAKALNNSDFKKLGRLMSETHEGLSKDYEVSCDEIDFLVDAVQHEKSVLGSRMMGGGFGGCSINLVEKGSEKELIGKISTQYRNAFGIELKAYKVKISKGTSLYKTKNDTIQP
ncbi:galactokinase [Flavobacterium sp. J49]|uniref:galactokinase n=1 Tax=Flavobacterium sp. J49 TaxID=2718534 RepID=UPI0015932C20|nr:galactokinase [Flavobacterium sp. J49]MBF6640563.1 galactokinase [Flavobacterium sp. J49]NIC01810.1 galactokinase [Flavobacterium sp. J49]